MWRQKNTVSFFFLRTNAAAVKLIGIAAEEKRDYTQSDQPDKKEERRKKATGGKAGGGAQGRETKTKSTKKKNVGGRRKAGYESDDDDAGSGDERNHDFSKKKKPEALQVTLVFLQCAASSMGEIGQYSGGPCSRCHSQYSGHQQAYPEPVHHERVDTHSLAYNRLRRRLN